MMDIVSSIQNNCAANKTTTEAYDKAPTASFMKNERENNNKRRKKTRNHQLKTKKHILNSLTKQTHLKLKKADRYSNY